MPKVSVLLPTYNGSRRILPAIQSVQQQTYKDWELLIIDDGSNDTTPVLVRGLAKSDGRIQLVVQEKNQGIQEALNKGMAMAQGEYIARIDDDDIWSDSNKLQKQVDFLTQQPDHVLVGTGARVVDEKGRELFKYQNPLTDSDIRQRMLYRNCFVHSAVLFRKKVADSVGGYSLAPEIKHIEDYDLWLKLGTMGKLANLPDYSILFQLRPSGALSAENKVIQFKRQRALIRNYKGTYPNYSWLSLKSSLRLYAYAAFGSLMPTSVVQKLLGWYKNH